MMKLLIIDDERNMRHMLQAMVLQYGYEIDTAENGRVALEKIKDDRFDFILCDVKMPDVDGMEFLDQGRDYLDETTVIMMSAYGNVDLALNAMKAGAYDFISKPFKSDEVLMTLKKAEEREHLRQENIRLKKKIAAISSDTFGKMVSGNRDMIKVFELAQKVAVHNTTVLITGESGTGKELVARGIHQHSFRKNKQFVAINCGSIPDHLLESELFGYIKGAFTGADRNKMGLLEEANGSTLFLDEIGELPLTLQVKLLRVLQEREIRPVGSKTDKKIDIRVLAATADDLNDRVENGSFREDLFYRLNVVPVRIPPLRKRLEDVPNLAQHFIYKFNSELGASVQRISPHAMELMLKYSWPGNVRELENAIQRAIVVSDGNIIESKHLPNKIQQNMWSAAHIEERTVEDLSLKKAQKELEADFISRALDVCNGNKSRASELLEISYPSLLQKIKNYNLEF